MLFEDKTLNNIMNDLKDSIETDMDIEEGSLIDHSFRGAAAEFERAYMGLGLIEKNGYAQTADREHLILRAKERGVEPFPASNAIWKAEFNLDIEINTRFSTGEFTYLCIEKIEAKTYRLRCEQSGKKGNRKQGELTPINYIEGFERGELIELLIPARDEEETETFRARYFSILKEVQGFGGNKTHYKQMMHELEGVGACKIYRVRKEEKRIKIYFLDNSYQTPNKVLVSEIQARIDPIGKQGEGEGQAPIFHVVDVHPCASELINIEAEITIDTGYTWKELQTEVEEKIDSYFLELAKSWENEEFIIVRILKINAAIASVEGIVDVQNTALNGKEENLLLNLNTIPVRGVITCRP